MIGGEFSLKRMEERKISELFLLCLLSLFSEKRKRKILSVEEKEASMILSVVSSGGEVFY